MTNGGEPTQPATHAWLTHADSRPVGRVLGITGKSCVARDAPRDLHAARRDRA
jgi:hypothetical protein